jgi:hypothetical protein
MNTTREAVIYLLMRQRQITTRALKKGLRHRHDLKDVINQMLFQGELDPVGTGKKGNPYRLVLTGLDLGSCPHCKRPY